MNAIAKYILNQKVGIKPFKVCFLPYKRAMWDSMKSVYMSLPNSYVCPIPYFVVKDGHIDMSVGMICEKDKFAEQCIDFNDFSTYKFDYVVIHNPYDDNNNLTYIHPMFHSDKLKEKSKIIYIPYGSMDNPDMIFQKGICNADLIFPNTQQEKEYIISEYAKKGIDMSSKVVYCGSPKKDCVFKHLNPVTNDRWENKIRKRVVLICTSILPFIANPEKKLKQYTDTIRDMVTMFKDTVIIFRPHPLMNELISSRFPDLNNEWVGLLAYVKRNAILSVYEDLSMCFNYADYLITDQSSIIEVWKATKKKYEIME